MTIPQWITPAGTLATVAGEVAVSTTVLATGNHTVYSIIAGSLPQGITLSSGGTIAGTTVPNVQNIDSVFVVRATDTQTGINTDRTFQITVLGSAAPVWPPIPGFIKQGHTVQGYFLENEWINIELLAHSPSVAPADYPITYSIAPGSHGLPEGITLVGNILSGIFATNVNDGKIKSYNFTILASDSIASSTQTFNISVISPNVFRADSTVLVLGTTASFLDLTVPGTVNISPLQNLQFLNGTDLGTVNSDDYQSIPVTVYDPAPLLGTVTYQLISGPGILNNLPPGLLLDAKTGYITGFIPYQASYTNRYNLTVSATKSGAQDFISAVNTFTLTVKGQVDSNLEWISSSNLGSIEAGTISELSVEARQINSDYNVKYQLTRGQLPKGLGINRAGNIQGRANTGTAGTYTFDVEASDVYNFGAVSQTFNLIVTQTTSTTYTEIYVQPMMSRATKSAYQNFINNEFTFAADLIYRYYDPNFGIQHTPRMIVEFGIEQLDLEYYVPALTENFYRRRFNFGDVKVAVAKDTHGTVIYEAVYVDIIDTLANSSGISVDAAITANGRTYYPASIANMRKRLQSLVNANNNVVGVDEYQNPKFMRTAQAASYKPPGYLHILPICYALPGQGNRIVSRIQLSGFDFKQINFEVDRLIVQNQRDNMLDKYLMLGKDSITDRPGQ